MLLERDTVGLFHSVMHICVENFHEPFMKSASACQVAPRKRCGNPSGLRRQNLHVRYNGDSSGNERNGNQGQK